MPGAAPGTRPCSQERIPFGGGESPRTQYTLGDWSGGSGAMRRLIRGWACRELFAALPLDWRAAVARRQAALGIVPAAVARRFDRGYDAVVCGHVHRQERIPFGGGEAPRTLYTLGDWSGGRGSYLVWQDGRFHFVEQP